MRKDGRLRGGVYTYEAGTIGPLYPIIIPSAEHSRCLRGVGQCSFQKMSIVDDGKENRQISLLKEQRSREVDDLLQGTCTQQAASGCRIGGDGDLRADRLADEGELVPVDAVVDDLGCRSRNCHRSEADEGLICDERGEKLP